MSLQDLERRPFQQILPGSKINLVKSHPDSVDALWESILRDREIRGQSWPWVESKDQLEEYLDESADELPSKEVVYFIEKNQTVIGTFHIHSLNFLDHKAELGYAIEKSHEGLGYVSESLKLVEAELRRLDFKKTVINCNVENRRSIQIAERNGYQREGTLIRDCIENGKFRDSALFGKIL